jgi:hypothetical protein
MKIFSTILSIGILLPSSLAQEASHSPVTRSVHVSVCDQRGNSLHALAKENFRVRVNGKSVEVLDARYTLAPRRMLILLDVSGSMAEENNKQKSGIAREAVEDFLSRTPSNVPIAMLTFSRQVRNVIDFNQGRSAIAAWLQESPSKPLKPLSANRTALFDAILEGLKVLQPFEPGDAIYAITDGGDNASQSAARLKPVLLSSGVRLFTFLFSEPGGGSPEERNARLDLLELVNGSGGYVFGIAGRQRPFAASWEVDYAKDKNSQNMVKMTTQALTAMVQGFWTLDLVLPPKLNKSQRMTVDVIESGGRSRKDIEVIYPHLLLGTN